MDAKLVGTNTSCQSLSVVMTAADIFYSFPRKIDLGLGRVLAALDILDRPQDRVAPIIHVAGTNGKGSTVAFLRAIIEASGQVVHAYTSPHIVTIHERWRVSGREITEPYLLELAQRVQTLSHNVPVTVFEAETLVAFLAFAENKADFTLLEVGLGGRLDATNVVTAPAMTIITPVDIDHAEMLGSTLALIATEKAGILKFGVPCVVGRQDPAALASIEDRAAIVGAPLLVFGRDWDCFAQRSRLVVQSEDRLLDLPAPSLQGAHQFENAGAAALAASLLGIEDDAIARGISSAVWPARLQRLTTGPYSDIAKQYDGELWLDGGHNPHGARAACLHMAALNKADPRPFGLVAGLLSTKDRSGFFAAFAQAAPFVVSVPVRSSEAGIPPVELAIEGRAAGLDVHVATTPLEGVRAAFEKLGQRARVIICGSLYLAGDVLSGQV
jgi:dihydrofolate synthase / folylpolyglutamate synthase